MSQQQCAQMKYQNVWKAFHKQSQILKQMNQTQRQSSRTKTSKYEPKKSTSQQRIFIRSKQKPHMTTHTDSAIQRCVQTLQALIKPNKQKQLLGQYQKIKSATRINNKHQTQKNKKSQIGVQDKDNVKRSYQRKVSIQSNQNSQSFSRQPKHNNSGFSQKFHDMPSQVQNQLNQEIINNNKRLISAFKQDYINFKNYILAQLQKEKLFLRSTIQLILARLQTNQVVPFQLDQHKSQNRKSTNLQIKQTVKQTISYPSSIIKFEPIYSFSQNQVCVQTERQKKLSKVKRSLQEYFSIKSRRLIKDEQDVDVSINILDVSQQFSQNSTKPKQQKLLKYCKSNQDIYKKIPNSQRLYKKNEKTQRKQSLSYFQRQIMNNLKKDNQRLKRQSLIKQQIFNQDKYPNDNKKFSHLERFNQAMTRLKNQIFYVDLKYHIKKGNKQNQTEFIDKKIQGNLKSPIAILKKIHDPSEDYVAHYL